MSSFTVAGMSSSMSSHMPNLSSWGVTGSSSQFGSSFGDSLSQPPRNQYQSGYLLSTSRHDHASQSSSRVDELPLIQSKARMNNTHARGSTFEFGMDSMFHSQPQRQTLPDEDAPPQASVLDIPYEVRGNSSSRSFPKKKSSLETSRSSRRPLHVPASQLAQPVYVIVFGYPPEQYSSMVEYFKSLGDATEPEQDKNIQNCFKIGYRKTADAMRAIGKNGDVIRGSFMIATKWAEPVHAEAALGPSFRQSLSGVTEAHSLGSAADTDETTQPPLISSVQNIGTPVQLHPASSAFRKQAALSESRVPFALIPNPLSGMVLPGEGIVQKILKLLVNWI